jgi:hypothetical protein
MRLDLYTQPQALPPSCKLTIPGGKAGTRKTLQLMAALVRQGRENPAIRAQALALVSGLPQKDYLNECRRIHAFVLDAVRYVRDPRGVETLHTAEQLLQQRTGDCDDKSILAASLLETIGHKTRLVAIGLNPKGFCHVFPEVNVRGRWYPVETTEQWAFGEMRLTPAIRMEQPV